METAKKYISYDPDEYWGVWCLCDNCKSEGMPWAKYCDNCGAKFTEVHDKQYKHYNREQDSIKFSEKNNDQIDAFIEIE